MITLLEKLISIDSSYPHEEQVGDFLVKFLKNLGFQVDIQTVAKGRFNIFARKGKGTKAILFLGHQDTVPLSNKNKWHTPPLKLTRIKDKFYGNGVADMKGGIAAFLTACQSSHRYLKVLLTVDEEGISQGAWAAVTKKKGFFSDCELVISAEPSFDGSVATITTGRIGRCVFEVEFQGKPVHLIRYQKGVDAIEKLGVLIEKLYRSRGKIFNSKDTIAQVRLVEGRSVGMSTPVSALAEIEVLIGYQDSVDSVKQALQRLTEGEIKVKPRQTPYLQAYKFDKFPYESVIAELIKEYTGEKMTKSFRRSVADDNILASLGVPVITWGPKGGNEHCPNEYVIVESLEKVSRMYQELLNRLVDSS